ncbi:MAG: hypothetical protein JSV99_07655 [Planctomycetota bacterium]|nr:MAG: hypothetical protein JSV99_07655 [Planctomycetota bacterium]
MNAGRKFLVLNLALRSLALVSVTLSSCVTIVESKMGPCKKMPVIFDTDIGDDIDDTWALALLLKSSEFDIKLVTTEVGDTLAESPSFHWLSCRTLILKLQA